MTGDKLEIAKRAIRELYDQLRDADILAIVAFETSVRTVLKATRKADQPSARLIGLVEGLPAGGGTDLNLGLDYRIIKAGRNASEHLRAASEYVPAPQFADDRVTLAKLIALAGNLNHPLVRTDHAEAGGGVPDYVMFQMNVFGRVRGGYGRRYF